MVHEETNKAFVSPKSQKNLLNNAQKAYASHVAPMVPENIRVNVYQRVKNQ